MFNLLARSDLAVSTTGGYSGVTELVTAILPDSVSRQPEIRETISYRATSIIFIISYLHAGSIKEYGIEEPKKPHLWIG